MKHEIAALMMSALLLTACSKPTETVIPSDMTTWDKELAPVVRKLSEEDQKRMTGYVAGAVKVVAAKSSMLKRLVFLVDSDPLVFAG